VPSLSCSAHRFSAECRPDAEELAVLRAYVDWAKGTGFNRIVVEPAYYTAEHKWLDGIVPLEAETITDYSRRMQGGLCLTREDREAVGAHKAPWVASGVYTLRVRVSRVGFNADHTQAMFYREIDIAGIIHIMERHGDSWRGVREWEVWNE
jgi:hypothetical protein